MELDLKITCTCHLAKITIMLSNATGCPDSSKNLHRGYFNTLNPNLPSDLLSDLSSNTSCQPASHPASQPASQQPGGLDRYHFTTQLSIAWCQLAIKCIG